MDKTMLSYPFETLSSYISNAKVKAQTVLVRADLDSLDDETSEIKNMLRLRLSARTVRQLLEAGAKNVVLCGHLGRPKGVRDEKLSVKHIHETLAELIGIEKTDIVISPDTGAERDQALSSLSKGQVLLLENLRFSEIEQSKNSPEERMQRGKELRKGCDLVVLDAAATLHRDKDVSVYEMVKSGASVAGPTVLEFIDSVGGILLPDAKTMAIFAGAKMADKAEAMLGLAEQVNVFCVLGLPSIAFHYAQGRKPVGKYVPSDEEIQIAQQIIDKRTQHGDSGLLVSDQFVTSASLDIQGTQDKSVEEGIDINTFTPDVSSQFIDKVIEHARQVDSVFVNGTPGIWESELHSHGTKQLVCGLENTGKRIIFGGGDATGSADAFSKHSENLIMITAGGATMEALAAGAEGWKLLPGVVALRESASSLSQA